MNRFTIEQNRFLTRNVNAFYHHDYTGGEWRNQGTIESYIVTLKNTFQNESDLKLNSAIQKIKEILLVDLPQVLRITGIVRPTVVVVPRAKVENTYIPKQLLFKQTINDLVNSTGNLINGTNFIIRHTNTFTTHLRYANVQNDGQTPNQFGPGITQNTCHISTNVRGRDILLIDDLYTRTVNVDEDAIQALFDNGANNVIFYSIGKTVSRYN